MSFLNPNLYRLGFDFAFDIFQITRLNNQIPFIEMIRSCFLNLQILKLLDTSCNCLKNDINHFCMNFTTIADS